MTRRALSPAAHGVLLAVRAALRGRVPQITDAADGTTTAVVLDPDGTRILRCEVRSVSRARDTRQPPLPLAPGAPHEVPAPVAVVPEQRSGEPARVAEAVAAQGDPPAPKLAPVLVHQPSGETPSRAEAAGAQGESVRYEALDREPERESSAVKRLAVRGKWCVLVRRAGQLFELHGAYKTEAEAESADRAVAEQFGVCDVLIVTPSRSTKGTRGHAHHGYAVERAWTVVASTDHHGWHRWLCADEATAMRVRFGDADAVAGLVVVSVFDPSGAVRHGPGAPTAPGAEATAPQDDDGPAPINGVCVGDRITLDDEPIEVMGVDHEGFAWRTIATDAKGRSIDEGDVLWREVVEPRPGHWRVTEVEAKASREKPLRPAKTTKPARLLSVPLADAVAAGYRGAIVIAWQATEDAAWERVWSAPSPKAAEIDSAWRAACEAHRARQYNRGGRCTRDSADGAA